MKKVGDKIEILKETPMGQMFFPATVKTVDDAGNALTVTFTDTCVISGEKTESPEFALHSYNVTR